MKILHDPNLPSDLANSNLFIDTNSFIAIAHFEELYIDILNKIEKEDCALLTIPSVLFEFTRGAQTIKEFNERTSFVSSLVKNIYPIEKHLSELTEFTVVLQRLAGNASYTDFLLCACLYKFPSSFLLTGNHKDFPISILNRKHLITVDTDSEIRTYGIYQLSKEKFNKLALKILGNKPIPENTPDELPF